MRTQSGMKRKERRRGEGGRGQVFISWGGECQWEKLRLVTILAKREGTHETITCALVTWLQTGLCLIIFSLKEFYSQFILVAWELPETANRRQPASLCLVYKTIQTVLGDLFGTDQCRRGPKEDMRKALHFKVTVWFPGKFIHCAIELKQETA